MSRLYLFLLLLFCTYCSAVPLNGTFLHLGYNDQQETISRDEVIQLLDQMKALKMDTLVIASTRAKVNSPSCSTGDFKWIYGLPAKLTDILSEANKRDIGVFVGTSLSMSSCPEFWLEPNASSVANDVAKYYPSLASLVNSSPAFRGWYISDEPGLLPAESFSYYQRIVSILRTISPGKEIMASPYLTDSASVPSELANRALSFSKITGVTIQAWQDGVGAFGMLPLVRRAGQYSVEDYFGAIRAKIGPQLWADVELFNYGEPLLNSGGAYRPASVGRLNQQLWATRVATKKLSWLMQKHMSNLSTSVSYPEAKRLFEAYSALYISGQYFSINKSYKWLTTPSSQYPDNGSELTNGHVGDPKNPMDSEWIGVLGGASFVVDLGAVKDINFVAVHALTKPSWGIRSPHSMSVSCSVDNVSFSSPITFNSAIQQIDLSKVNEQEYAVSNTNPLNVKNCRYVKVALFNSYWTFISEVEINR